MSGLLNGAHKKRAEKDSATNPDIARRLFYLYETDSGPQLRWRSAPSRFVKAGDLAGSVHLDGYRVVKIDGKYYRAHRLIFAYYHGRWPADQIDHIDGDRLNNRIENLREVSNAENCRNQKLLSNNTSGVTGVVWYKPTAKWKAQIRVNRRDFSLGYFKNFDDAVAARRQAEIDHGFHPNHGRKV